MLVAVDLDDELRLQAAEVGDKITDRHLPAKVRVLDGKAMAQMPPESFLRLGLGAAQSPGPRALTLRRRFRFVLSPG
jgi:hypothetical protein